MQPMTLDRRRFSVGQTIGNVEVIAVNKDSYTLLCSCGNMIEHPKVKETLPQACKECTKINHRNTYTTVKDSNSSISIREYNAVELLMFKELSGSLSVKEFQALKAYRKGIKNRKTV